VVKIPIICRARPRKNMGLKMPASRARPENIPMPKRRNICRLPIQEIVLCDSGRTVSK
jgi:hypothetical protein